MYTPTYLSDMKNLAFNNVCTVCTKPKTKIVTWKVTYYCWT